VELSPFELVMNINGLAFAAVHVANPELAVPNLLLLMLRPLKIGAVFEMQVNAPEETNEKPWKELSLIDTFCIG
jgi:hypothetical protein